MPRCPLTGWDTRKALNYVPKLFELRETYGFDHHLLHDGHRYSPTEAAQLGKRSSLTRCSGWRM
jgi:mannonate dehydratase